MTRLTRRASLLVALNLLTSAATSYAECAWGLWQQQKKSVTPSHECLPPRHRGPARGEGEVMQEPVPTTRATAARRWPALAATQRVSQHPRAGNIRRETEWPLRLGCHPPE